MGPGAGAVGVAEWAAVSSSGAGWVGRLGGSTAWPSLPLQVALGGCGSRLHMDRRGGSWANKERAAPHLAVMRPGHGAKGPQGAGQHHSVTSGHPHRCQDLPGPAQAIAGHFLLWTATNQLRGRASWDPDGLQRTLCHFCPGAPPWLQPSRIPVTPHDLKQREAKGLPSQNTMRVHA